MKGGLGVIFAYVGCNMEIFTKASKENLRLF